MSKKHVTLLYKHEAHLIPVKYVTYCCQRTFFYLNVNNHKTSTIDERPCKPAERIVLALSSSPVS